MFRRILRGISGVNPKAVPVAIGSIGQIPEKITGVLLVYRS